MTDNERGKELESAANSIIKNNKKFWIGYIAGTLSVFVLVLCYILGKWVG